MIANRSVKISSSGSVGKPNGCPPRGFLLGTCQPSDYFKVKGLPASTALGTAHVSLAPGPFPGLPPHLLPP